MQLDLSEDQILLRDTTVRFIETELPLARTRSLHDTLHGFERGWLCKGAELGWFAMLVPPDAGGGSVSESGVSDAALLCEQIGRYVQPGPFVPMNVVAAVIAAHGGSAVRADLLPRLASAETIATWAFAAVDGSFDHGAGARIVDGALSGSRGFVQDAAMADVLLVAAALDGEPVHVLVQANATGVSIEPLESLDLSRRFAHVRFEGVKVDDDAVLSGGAESLDLALRTAIVLNVSDTVGAIDHLLEMTVAYAKDRTAFGRPIGSFQALKHLLADQLYNVETCKAVADAARRSVVRGDARADEVVSMAAAYVGDVSHDVAQECLQVHGGIGFTWEHDLHLLMRRVRSNAALYGEPTWHRERVCRWYGLGDRDQADQ